MIETELAPTVAPAQDSAGPPIKAFPQSDPPVKSGLRRSTKIALIVVAVLSLLEVAAFAGTYALYTRHYVSTDNAQVDGDQIVINAPATGNVTDWSISEGSTVRDNQAVGRIQAVGSGAQPKRAVRSPGAGTIAVNAVVEGQYVTEGTTLAAAYDPRSISNWANRSTSPSTPTRTRTYPGSSSVSKQQQPESSPSSPALTPTRRTHRRSTNTFQSRSRSVITTEHDSCQE